MKKLIIAIFVVLALFIFSVPMAMAYKITFTGGSGYGPYQTLTGGEFTVELKDGLEIYHDLYDPLAKDVLGLSGTIQTFCIEDAETVSRYATYDVILNTEAIYGSVGPAGDPLSLGAAWLYHEFQIAGDFGGYDFNPYNFYDYTNPGRSGSGYSADYFQKAIWMLEEEIGWNASNPFIGAALSEFGDKTEAMKNNWVSGKLTYPVMVMNLYEEGHVGEAAFRKQDQLICVPDASIMFLLGPALLSLGLLGRRRRKSKE